MPHRISTKVALVGLAALAWLTPEALADKKLVQPPKEWTGSVADETLLKDAPECLTGPKGFNKLWNGWKIADPVPEVDFAKQIVVVAVTRGSRLKLAPTLDECNHVTSACL